MNPIVKIAIDQAPHLTDEEKIQTVEIFELVIELENYLKGRDGVIVLNALDLLKYFYLEEKK